MVGKKEMNWLKCWRVPEPFTKLNLLCLSKNSLFAILFSFMQLNLLKLCWIWPWFKCNIHLELQNPKINTFLRKYILLHLKKLRYIGLVFSLSKRLVTCFIHIFSFNWSKYIFPFSIWFKELENWITRLYFYMVTIHLFFLYIVKHLLITT